MDLQIWLFVDLENPSICKSVNRSQPLRKTVVFLVPLQRGQVCAVIGRVAFPRGKRERGLQKRIKNHCYLLKCIFAKMKSTVLQNEKYIFGEGEKGVCGGGQKK